MKDRDMQIQFMQIAQARDDAPLRDWLRRPDVREVIHQDLRVRDRARLTAAAPDLLEALRRIHAEAHGASHEGFLLRLQEINAIALAALDKVEVKE